MRHLFYTGIFICQTLLLTAQVGKVGINTTSPQALFHVADSSVLFSAPHVLPEPAGLPPVETPGNRLMWYADKAAFRAGGVQSDQWARDSIGSYSFASGLNTVANKSYSTAFGLYARAAGDNSTAIGKNVNATGPGSIAIGEETSASNYGSIALGYASAAPGYSGMAMGYGNTAYGNYTTALGYLNFAGGNFSLIFGEECGANGLHSLVGGQYSATDADFGIAIGQGLYTTSYMSTTFGRYNHTDLAYSLTDWVETDPLFVIGNGDGGTYTNALTLLKNGNLGLGPTDPTDKLEVDGSVRLGTNGSSLQEVIKTTVALDISSISSGASGMENMNIPGAATGSTVHISPANALSDGLVIAYARVSAANTVEVKFCNMTGSTIDPASMEFYVTIIR